MMLTEFLVHLVDFSISIMSADDGATTDKKQTGNIVINLCHSDQLPIGINLASGFERFIVGLAIRIALAQISYMLLKPNFLYR